MKKKKENLKSYVWADDVAIFYSQQRHEIRKIIALLAAPDARPSPHRNPARNSQSSMLFRSERTFLALCYFFCCVHAKQFSYFYPEFARAKVQFVKLCRKHFNAEMIRWKDDESLRDIAKEEKKLENFLPLKIYDFVFSYERSEYAEQRKTDVKEKKIFSFFHSESANLSVIFSQSNANFLPTFHFNTISYHLINMFNATQLIFDFTWTRNKRN